MPKVGKNIYKRKDGRWEGRYIKEKINGKAKYASVYASSVTEVRRKLDAAKKDVENKMTFEKKVGIVSEISSLWLTEVSPDLKESSIIKYESILRNYILPEFGDREFSDITNEDMISFVANLRKSGGVNQEGLAPSTVSEIVTTLNSMRIFAIRRDYIVRFNPECVTIKRDQHKIRVFSVAEEKRLIDYLNENINLTSIGIMICLYTGIRIGELCALRWEDINLKEKTMSITKTMQRLRVKGNEDKKTEVKILMPKSAHSIRTIPIPDVLVKLLTEYQSSEGYVLTGDKENFVEPRTLQKRFKRILKKCNIEDAKFHTTRHTFATRCVELNFDTKTLSEILGHSSVTITLNKYVHPTMQHKAENMNRFTGLFDN
ncbi:MAG: site-specific integrase [Lachnospiraceae bacterium]|nr:site-specific integrase [Lachnospiraceae bacterium]